ncbi:fructokinase-1-like [Chenopodium quinoa]|uniref:Carbohydrate kinase PfkB domain-containing protein n=1 Tax=Chenopodium quinoa TaxID=63459 RepID=A0A803LFG3_CHEQI|nr:fructokinase-1-like [Chenopodium quinoa]
MHHFILSPKFLISSNVFFPSLSLLPPTNPNSIIPSNSSKTLRNSIVNCRGIEVSVLSNHLNSLSSSNYNGSIGNEKLRNVDVKDVDIATLGNLCVDIVLNIPQLPPKPLSERKAYMDSLSSSPPDKQYWEAGGHCNTAIAAARLGLRCRAIGHVGNEIYGSFLQNVLHDEGIGFVEMVDDLEAVKSVTEAYQTLLCWVLVDPMHRHGFCSRADFSDEPAFSWINELSRDVKLAIKESKILVVNGYGFDELSPGFIVSALKYAVEVGTSVFFDPGPKGKSLSMGSPEEQIALNELLKMSDVLLLTSDEAESLTGIGNPILAGQELLKRGSRTKWVIIKMGSKGSILVTLSGTSCAPSYKVKIIDTVGCGDSFVAAVAFGFVHEMPMIHTLAIANAVGAATAMGCGAGRNVATLTKAMELIKAGDLNEDDKFWRDLLDKTAEVQEFTLLSKKVINEKDSNLNCVSFEKIFPEITSKLELAKLFTKVFSSES